jgi:phosphoribosylaminoimidazole carboxylase (NCAIR synthetase)
MKTKKTNKARKNENENARKKLRKAEMRPFLQRMKQMMYFQRTGRWIHDAEKLHWHHKDASQKTRKLAHLTTRSEQRIAKELRNCVVLHVKEHLALHNKGVLRTK